jgi:hypothetical protein
VGDREPTKNTHDTSQYGGRSTITRERSRRYIDDGTRAVVNTASERERHDADEAPDSKPIQPPLSAVTQDRIHDRTFGCTFGFDHAFDDALDHVLDRAFDRTRDDDAGDRADGNFEYATAHVVMTRRMSAALSYAA